LAAGAGRKGLLGRVVNALGLPVDGKGPIKSDVPYRWKKSRRASSNPVGQPTGQTGIMAVDADDSIGRAARIDHGDRSTGKTTLVDTIIGQARLTRRRSRRRQDTAHFTAFMWRWARAIECGTSHQRFGRGRRDAYTIVLAATASDSHEPYSLRSPGRRWVNGSWTTAWTH